MPCYHQVLPLLQLLASIGYIWHNEESREDNDEEMDIRNRQTMCMGFKNRDCSFLKSEEEGSWYFSDEQIWCESDNEFTDEERFVQDMGDLHIDADESHERRESKISTLMELQAQKARESAKKEIIATVSRSINENHTLENSITELNSFKMAENIGFVDLLNGITSCLVKYVDLSNSNSAAKSKSILTKWSSLILKYTNSEEDEINILWLMIVSKERQLIIFIGICNE